MPPTGDEARRRLGFFGPFMAAWHAATDAARAAVTAATAEYELGRLAAVDYLAVVERELNVRVPVERLA